MENLGQFEFDHITLVANTLEHGSNYVHERLGVKTQPGGKHPTMGTHNRFLRLGSDSFLEIVAINPLANSPNRTRWFGLDVLEGRVPRLCTWVIRTMDIQASLSESCLQHGQTIEVTRDDLTWKTDIAVDGVPPMGGASPTLIEWPAGSSNPAFGMDDVGCSLARLDSFTFGIDGARDIFRRELY